MTSEWVTVPVEPDAMQRRAGCTILATKGGSPGFHSPIVQSIYRAMLAARPARPVEPVVRWEVFLDDSYYGMWGFRPIGSRSFNDGFHVVDKNEAERLLEALNSAPPDTAAIVAQARREALEEAASWHDAQCADAMEIANRFRGGSHPYMRWSGLAETHRRSAAAIRALIDQPQALPSPPADSAMKGEG